MIFVTDLLIKDHLDPDETPRFAVLYDLQHGFRERGSCETKLIQLVEDLSRSLTEGKQTDLILLDFSKAWKVKALVRYQFPQVCRRGPS